MPIKDPVQRKAQRGLRDSRFTSVAFYGPDDTIATKVAVKREGAAMPDANHAAGRRDAGDFDRGLEGHRRRQARLGLTISPAERLRWLEKTMEELRGLLGRAWRGRPLDQKTD